MTRRRIARFVPVALAAATFVSVAPPARAQVTNPLVGSWTITYERGRRVENGEVTPIMAEGKLQIAVSGDSLVATLTAGPRPDGTVPPPASFGGRIAGDSAVFAQTQTVQVNLNGEMSSREVSMTWALRASGDALSGTLLRELPGMPEAASPTPVKGKRVG
jgi:hypothetical protein